jgi:lysophospholipase L1-like esterase
LLGLLLAELLARGLIFVKRQTLDRATLSCDDPNANTCPYQPFQADQIEAMAFDPLTGTRWVPGYQGEWITINSLGFRGEEMTLNKPSETLRIVIVGSSAAFGVGVRDEEAFTTLLEANLAEQIDQEVEVINAGITGANSTQELIVLETRVIALEPDIVVIYDGRNDLYFATSPLWQPHYPPALQHLQSDLSQNGGQPSLGDGLAQMWAALGQRSALVGGAQQVASLIGGKQADPSELSMHDEALTVYRDNLRYMVAVLQATDIQPVLVYQPIIAAGDKTLTDEEQERYDAAQAEGFLDLLADAYPAGEAVVLEVGEEFDVPTYSLVGVFDDVQGTVYLDDVHYNPLGNAVVAERLAEIVLELE